MRIAHTLPRGPHVIDERDCVLHSWCVQDQWQAPTIVGGRGARFWAADGREWLDMSSLAECSHLGHQHPRVVEAIRNRQNVSAS